ncbi:MAG TPA: ChaN family lipoprotein [Geobacteraceae bacterium]
MRKSVPIAVGLVMAALLAMAVTNSFGRQEVVRLSDGARIDFRKLVNEVERSRVIFVGETHTSMADHRLQLRLIKALHRRGIPLAIATEMFTAASQDKLDAWVAGTLGLDSFIRFYYAQWRMPWPYYRAILTYARDERIPLVGLNVPEEIPGKVAREGFDSLSPAERAQLPDGITCTIDASYREFIRRAFREHRTSEKQFVSFCEAQMLWNKTMAWHLAAYLKRNPQRTVVVLTGTGHALKKAIPGELADYLSVPTAVIMPKDSAAARSVMTTQDADYLALR